jgi:hypothetical protein
VSGSNPFKSVAGRDCNLTDHVQRGGIDEIEVRRGRANRELGPVEAKG